MKKSIVSLMGIGGLLGALCASAVWAQTLEQIDQQKVWHEDTKQERGLVEQACGKPVTVDFDAASWAAVPADQQRYSLGSYCANGCLTALEQLCGSDAGRAAVVSRIDSVHCAYHANDDIAVSLQGKTMNCTFNLNDMQFQDTVKAKLRKIM